MKQITSADSEVCNNPDWGAYSESPLEIEGWEQSEVGTNRIISFVERRSCRPLPRVRGSPTIIFFLD